ncbi:MAG: cobalt ECF transporter T component CbiQ [Lachnospiraceae bacterium]|nr:cobalt ECF transporter T component CbiQ [Lachnospiraceae bacterium]MDE6980336.1 cobalt ECF transporter T component CbiQ [Lachnospiraceae bacterium]
MSSHPSIDSLCASSGLRKVCPGIKCFFALYCMVLSVAGNSPWMGFFLAALLSGTTLLVGKISPGSYLRLMSIPLGFLLISCLTLLVDMGQGGLWHGSLLGISLCITKVSLSQAALALGRSLGALCALYFLSLSTPVPEIIGILKKLHVPSFFTGLMYLVYRCIFILFSMHHSMKTAAKSRLGFGDYHTSLSSVGKIYANLLHRSYNSAMEMFHAMESRCFQGEITFYEFQKYKTTKKQKLLFAVTSILLLILFIFLSQKESL